MSNRSTDAESNTALTNRQFENWTENVSEVFVAPRLSPESYPGKHPEMPCSLLDGDDLYGMRWNADSGLLLNQSEFEPVLDTPSGSVLVDDYLRSRDLPTLAERQMLTAFGSNRCPGQLLDKFRKAATQTEAGHADQASRPDLEVVPMFQGTLRGYDTVYNAKAGNMGYFFADLYQGPETTDTEIEVSVLFLTQEQLRIIHETEKEYDFKLLGEVELGKMLYSNEPGVSMTVPAFAHVGKVSAYTEVIEGQKPQPIAVAEVYAKGRTLKAQGQSDFQDTVFGYDPVGDKQRAFVEVSGDPGIVASGQNYVTNMSMERAGGIRKLSERKRFQALLNEAITDRERIIIDPDQFNAVNVDLDTQPIPNLGEYAVLKFLRDAGKKI